MSGFINIIPFIEVLLVLGMLGLGSLGYLSLRRRAGQPNQNRSQFIEKWILPGLIVLSILAILLLFVVTFT